MGDGLVDRSRMTPDATATATAARQVQVDHGVRIAELVATLSYAADLGLGQPMDHCLRQTVIAGRLAELAGATERERATTFYLGLLINSHCHADAAEQAAWFADDIAFKGEGVETLGMNTAQLIAFFMRRVGSHGSVAERARRLATFPLSGQQLVLGFMTTHAALGAQFAERIGLDPEVSRRGRPGVRAVGRQGGAGPAARGADRAACAPGAAGRAGRGVQPSPRPAGGGGDGSAARGHPVRPGAGRLFAAPRRRGARRPGRGRELGRRARRRAGAVAAASAGPTSTASSRRWRTWPT